MNKYPESIKIGPFFPGLDEEQKKRTPCPQAVKEALWRKYFGSTMEGKCYVCGANISFTNFEPGHNTPHTKGGEWKVPNLRCLCRTCNRSMGDKMTIEAFKKKYFEAKSKTKTTKTKTSTRAKPKPKASTAKPKPKASTAKPKPKASTAKPKPKASTAKPKPKASTAKPKPKASTAKPKPKGLITKLKPKTRTAKK